MNLKYLFSIGLCIPIIACSATDTTTVSQAETNTDTLVNINTYGCKNLHKVTGIHDMVILDDMFKGSDYKEYTSYYWLNSEKSKNKSFLEIEVDTIPEEYSIELHNKSRNASIYCRLFNY